MPLHCVDARLEERAENAEGLALASKASAFDGVKALSKEKKAHKLTLGAQAWCGKGHKLVLGAQEKKVPKLLPVAEGMNFLQLHARCAGYKQPPSQFLAPRHCCVAGWGMPKQSPLKIGWMHWLCLL